MTKLGSSRTISLPPELGGYIDEMVAGGHGDASAIVRTALEQLRDRAATPADSAVNADITAPAFSAENLIGGGECGMLVRQRDWRATSLGPIESWPAELRVTLANILNSPVAKVVMWGPEHIMLYNDSYRAIAGDRHPAALGSPVATAFPEI
jgi:Arc/MetJ-type ribon-helix-helix transcriptional regulator